MRSYKIFGRPFRACGIMCAEGFKSDRTHGIMYGPSAVRQLNGDITISMSREEWSIDVDHCAYCNAPNERS